MRTKRGFPIPSMKSLNKYVVVKGADITRDFGCILYRCISYLILF